MKKDLGFIIVGLIMAIAFIYFGIVDNEPNYFYAAAGTGFFVGIVLWLLNYFRNKNRTN